MKKICLVVITLVLTLFGTVGCVKRDSMEDIDIITSSYPIEYLVDQIYGEHSNIENIFPDDEEIDTYEFNEKQYGKFSKKDLFVYNGNNSSDIALELINRNNDLLLIDATLGMNYTYGVEEFWLDPSNLLMMALNVKKGLEEYVSNSILIKEIDEAYSSLKVSLSELDAEIKLVAQHADDATIVVTNNSLKYLEKYGFSVIVLNDNSIDKIYKDVKDLVNEGKIKYIYVFEEDTVGEKLDSFIKDNNIEKSYLYRLDSITDEQRKNDDDYISIMKDNLDLLKLEVYD